MVSAENVVYVYYFCYNQIIFVLLYWFDVLILKCDKQNKNWILKEGEHVHTTVFILFSNLLNMIALSSFLMPLCFVFLHQIDNVDQSVCVSNWSCLLVAGTHSFLYYLYFIILHLHETHWKKFAKLFTGRLIWIFCFSYRLFQKVTMAYWCFCCCS